MSSSKKKIMALVAVTVMAAFYLFFHSGELPSLATPARRQVPSTILRPDDAVPSAPAASQPEVASPTPDASVDPERTREAKNALADFVKNWEVENSQPLHAVEGTAAGGVSVLHLPPFDADARRAATELLDRYGIPAGNQDSLLSLAGAVNKHRYVSYVVSPEDESHDSMWIAYVSDLDSVKIDPFTGNLVIAPKDPGDSVAPLTVPDGLKRYSHLFQVVTDSATQ